MGVTKTCYFPAFRDKEGNRLVFPYLCYTSKELAETVHVKVDKDVQLHLGYVPDGVEEAPVAECGGSWLHHVMRGCKGTPVEEAVISGPYLDKHCACEHH